MGTQNYKCSFSRVGLLNPWRRVTFEKLTVTQMTNKSPGFKEHESPQSVHSEPHPEVDDSNSHPYNRFISNAF
jgi:hypothetical protein